MGFRPRNAHCCEVLGSLLADGRLDNTPTRQKQMGREGMGEHESWVRVQILKTQVKPSLPLTLQFYGCFPPPTASLCLGYGARVGAGDPSPPSSKCSLPALHTPSGSGDARDPLKNLVIHPKICMAVARATWLPHSPDLNI